MSCKDCVECVVVCREVEKSCREYVRCVVKRERGEREGGDEERRVVVESYILVCCVCCVLCVM